MQNQKLKSNSTTEKKYENTLTGWIEGKTDLKFRPNFVWKPKKKAELSSLTIIIVPLEHDAKPYAKTIQLSGIHPIVSFNIIYRRRNQPKKFVQRPT